MTQVIVSEITEDSRRKHEASAARTMRRSHASRRAATRRRVVKSTIRCLNAFGYSGTTIDTILAEAGVSRGRLLNVFPTKVDIMVAVGAYVWEVDRRFAGLWLRNWQTSPVDVASLVDRAWAVLSRPAGIAVLEILVACRSDTVLSDKFVPEHREVQAESVQASREILRQLNIEEQVDAKEIHDLMEGCIRGLVIDRPFDAALEEMPVALRLLKKQLQNTLDQAR